MTETETADVRRVRNIPNNINTGSSDTSSTEFTPSSSSSLSSVAAPIKKSSPFPVPRQPQTCHSPPYYYLRITVSLLALIH